MSKVYSLEEVKKHDTASDCWMVVHNKVFIYIKMAIIYTVEGNIGSGKSTLVKILKKLLPQRISATKFIFLQEPVDIWNTIKDRDGKTIIEKFYSNQEKYSFPFQIM